VRRRGFLVASLLAGLGAEARADVGVPLQLQAQLVSRLAAFDRNFPIRAGSLARVLVVSKANDGESKRVATTVARALAGLREVGGVTAKIDELELGDPGALAAKVTTEHVSLVYLSVGLEGDTPALAKALTGVSVLTVGATGAHVARGAVAGLDVEEGRPKIVIHLARARAQNVSFKAELLKLARIVE